MPTAETARGVALVGCDRPLVEAYDTAMFDLDGVVYVAGEAVADSPQHLARAVRAGITVAFVTNNASRPPAAVAERLRRIGVACAPHDVVTSAQAAARLVSERVPVGSPVLVVGGDGLVTALGEHGLRAVTTLAQEPVAVVQGFDPDVGWRQLSEGAAAVTAGLPWVASNTDLTVPTARGPAPGNGALVEVVARTTGRRPEVAGKPEPPLFAETMLRVGGHRPLVVGDRLDTDIEGAVRFGADSLLVLTGVTDVVELAMAPPGQRPSYVATDLRGLFERHPEPVHGPDGVLCGGWTARLAAEEGVEPALLLTGGGAADDAVRALVSLCWATTASSPTAQRVAAAWRAADVSA